MNIPFMQDLNIKIKYSKTDFTDLYFGERGNNIFFYKEIRSSTILILTFVFLALIGFIVAYINVEYWFVCLIPSLILILMLFPYLDGLRKLYGWRKSVMEFINDKVKLKSTSIVLTESSISFDEDNKISIVTWPDIRTVTFENNCIILNGTKSYMILKNSVTEEEYEKIKDYINRKIKNGL